MESCYDLLGDIRALYSTSDNYQMCSLARMCQHLLIAIEEESDDYNSYPEIHKQILKYLLQMCHILREEKNFKRRGMGYDILYKLTNRLI